MDDRAPIGTVGELVSKLVERQGFTEDALALRFADQHAHELRYVAAWGKWLLWTGTHWRIEDTLAAFDMARKICRQAASECNKPTEAKSLSKAKTVAAVETLARSDRRIAAVIDQWDADPASFNLKSTHEAEEA